MKQSVCFSSMAQPKYDQIQDIKQLQSELDEWSKKCISLEEENSSLKRDLEHMCKMRFFSDDKKLAEIMRLKLELAETERNYKDRNLSLLEETESLKLKLKETVKNCTDLLRKLDRGGDRASALVPTEKIAKTTARKQSTPNAGELQESRMQIADNFEKKFHEVSDINRQWAVHCQQQVVQIKSLEQQLAKSRRPQVAEEQQKGNNDRVVVELKGKVELLEEERAKLECDNGQLRVMEKGLRERLTTQEELTRRLQEQLNSKAASQFDQPSSNNSSISIKEQVEILKQQAHLYYEDFKAERRDRERAASRVADLQNDLERASRREAELGNEIATYKYQFDEYERRGLVIHPRRRVVNSNSPEPCSHGANYNNQGTPVGYRARGNIQCDGIETDASNQQIVRDFSETDGQGRKVKEEDENSSTFRTQTFLLCPNCRKEFSYEKHRELLEHVESCYPS